MGLISDATNFTILGFPGLLGGFHQYGNVRTKCRISSAILNNRNPFAGRFVEDLTPLFDIGGQLGERLMADAVKMLSRPPVSYGKAAIVGVAGDMEHGGAMIHPKLGKPMRAAGKALIPSNAKVAATDAPIDLPLGHKDEPWSFDHFDTMTVMVADAPRSDEIVLCMAVSDGERPHPRVGNGPITD